MNMPVNIEGNESEQQIATCVRVFYTKAQQDEALGPVFDKTITDWDHHYKIVHDFWSRILLGTQRYSGMPFPTHVKLPIQPEHFDRWIEIFIETCHETLAPPLAEQAIMKARMMASSIRMGMFPGAEHKTY